MRITCLISSLRLGGAERQLVGLASLLGKSGHQVDVLTYREGDFYAADLERAGIPHTRLDPSGGSLKLVRRIAGHVRDNGTEVLISFLVGPNIKACLAHRRYPHFKLVVSERNCNTCLLPHDLFRFTLFRMEADAVVCNSHAQTAFVSRHCPGLRLKLETIPNFVDMERFPFSERPCNVPRRVVTVARLNPRKNVLGLIRAAAEPGLEGLRFDWYGAGADNSYKRRCEALIARKGLQERFVLHLASDNPALICSQADAFCLPSFYEGTPNSLAEALSCGLPAVCSDVSDNAGYVIPGRNGFLFNPTDVRSMVRALRRLAAMDDQALAESGSQSRTIAENNFPKELFIKRYSELLRGL